MKKFFISCSVFLLALVSKAQNVAINTDGTNADGSSLLDVKSTTKGILIPRMTTVQRTAITSPALGLLVFDTDTKTIWAFDGGSWVNLSTTGSTGFTLPFDQTVTLPANALRIVNTQGTSIRAEGNVAISAYSPLGNAINANAVYGTALNGQTNSAAPAINGYNPIGKGILGQSDMEDGIKGVSNGSQNKAGVWGHSNNGIGVKGSSVNRNGIEGSTDAGGTFAGVLGINNQWGGWCTWN